MPRRDAWLTRPRRRPLERGHQLRNTGRRCRRGTWAVDAGNGPRFVGTTLADDVRRHGPSLGTTVRRLRNGRRSPGARAVHDGTDAVRIHASGAANLPVESLELDYPLEVVRYELVKDGGGAGTYRGGLPVRRDTRVLGTEATLSTSADRQRRPASGCVAAYPAHPVHSSSIRTHRRRGPFRPSRRVTLWRPATS